MADTDLRIKTASHRYGGGITWVRLCSTDGSSTLTVWTILPYYQSKGATPVFDTSDLLDQSQALINSQNDLKNYEIPMDLIQFDKATDDFIKGAKGLLYNVLEYNGVVNNKYQFDFYPLCYINETGEDKSDWNKKSIMIKSSKNDAAIVVTTNLPVLLGSTYFCTSLTTVAIAAQRSRTEQLVT
jgi:hypothetical protein